METIITLWNANRTVLNHTILEETEQCDNTTFPLSQLPSDAVELTLQSSLPGYNISTHSQYLQMFEHSTWDWLNDSHNQFWLILGLSILLILYIISTVICLRRVRNRGGYDIVAKNADKNLQTGNFSAFSELNGQHPPASVQSDTGSRDTDQESIIVSEYLILILIFGVSQSLCITESVGNDFQDMSLKCP